MGKIRGPIDWVLNLPSHHRVHHAINVHYLDKNYGATLIVWDRLFGTYVEEVEPCVFGITKPLGSFNPLWAQVHYFIELAEASVSIDSAASIVSRVWAGVSGVVGRGATEQKYAADDKRSSKYDAAPERRRAPRLWRRSTFSLARPRRSCVDAFLHASLAPAVLGVACAALAAGLVAMGGLLEAKPWARPVEAGQLLRSRSFLCSVDQSRGERRTSVGLRRENRDGAAIRIRHLDGDVGSRRADEQDQEGAQQARRLRLGGFVGMTRDESPTDEHDEEVVLFVFKRAKKK